MTLRLAGPGTRSYAFVVDWHIRLLAVLGWGALAVALRLSLPQAAAGKLSSNPVMVTVMVAAGVTYFLYHPALELIMRGRTPGKRIAGARIVTLEGGMPGTSALLMRNLFRLLDCLPVFYLVGLVCCLVTRQRVRIGDMAAGTVLILDESASAQSLTRFGRLLGRSSLSPEILELIQDLLERWTSLEETQRLQLARALLGKIGPQRDHPAVATLDAQTLRSLLEEHIATRRD